MANSLEIFQNTLLKLVVRSGTDSDRQNVVLDVGEIGYTTDTKRLYVGDGNTYGGILAGNVQFGSSADFASITNLPAIGDLIFVTGNSTLYRYNGGTATLPTSWTAVGRIYSAANDTIVFSASGNQIRVGTLSAGNFANDAIGSSLSLDTGRIALSSEIAIDRIKSRNTTFVSLPSSLKIGDINYEFPTSDTANTFLTNDGSGNLSWRSATTLLTAASATLIPGPGLSLLVNGVSSTRALLLTSGDIQINGRFIPTAFVEFNQSGVISRSVGVQSVSLVTYNTLTGYSNVGGAVPLRRPPYTGPYAAVNNNVYEPVNITGAWRILLDTNVSALSSTVEVNVKNARFQIARQKGLIYSSSLDSRYFFTQAVGNEIIIYTYVPVLREWGGDVNGSSYDLSFEYLTPGSQDASTRFSVTVYG